MTHFDPGSSRSLPENYRETKRKASKKSSLDPSFLLL
jgi:hypothetical protein